MKKNLSIALFLVFTMFFSLSTNAIAATGDSIIKYYTVNSYYGIGGSLVIPSNVSAANGNVINFQLGLADTVEAGVSFSSAGWKIFINTGYHACKANSNNTEVFCSKYWRSVPLTTQPAAGDVLNLKIVNNGNNTVSYFLNGTSVFNGYDWGNLPVYTSLPATTKVKFMHITSDFNGTTRYNNAEWKDIVLRANASGSVYTNWTSSIPRTSSHTNEGNFTIHSSFNPLKTSFQAH
ncbi:hypothetical protein [Paenibacillus radicis (ex Gao et al. 2016)]|uniref:Uncharacterized protein n=1 Tax=Paenibacillus radicis (ex Gao et al. 2016) TaxID=1737354 RepID=A0A917GMU4_9BACL|nr:hypothetical protein [Paenibacillus radicis (ex Gao et al. 2016)]GGG52091.1 hypothetical protein GCM10010918_00970 [Paenibacillus radicis (ex Gao et al. 2016)]